MPRHSDYAKTKNTANSDAIVCDATETRDYAKAYEDASALLNETTATSQGTDSHPSEEHIHMYVYPDGVYMSRSLTDDSAMMIKEFQDKYLVGQEINPELHVTLVYSKKSYSGEEDITINTDVMSGTIIGYDLFGEDNNILVAKLRSTDLTQYVDELKSKYGFVSDYDAYQPHVTLSYNVGDFDVTTLPIMEGTLYFTNETVANLNADWKPKGDDDE